MTIVLPIVQNVVEQRPQRSNPQSTRDEQEVFALERFSIEPVSEGSSDAHGVAHLEGMQFRRYVAEFADADFESALLCWRG